MSTTLCSALELLEEFFISFNRDSDLYPSLQQGANGQSMMLGGVDSDGNEVDEPVLANGAGKQHTITLERSGNAVGGVYVAEGVTGTVYEAFHETEDGKTVTFARGTWGSSESAAEHVDDEHFAGPGVLKVLHDQLANPLIIIVR